MNKLLITLALLLLMVSVGLILLPAAILLILAAIGMGEKNMTLFQEVT